MKKFISWLKKNIWGILFGAAIATLTFLFWGDYIWMTILIIVAALYCEQAQIDKINERLSINPEAKSPKDEAEIKRKLLN